MFAYSNRKRAKMNNFIKYLIVTFFKLIVTKSVILVFTYGTTIVVGKEFDSMNGTNSLENANVTTDLNNQALVNAEGVANSSKYLDAVTNHGQNESLEDSKNGSLTTLTSFELFENGTTTVTMNKENILSTTTFDSANGTMTDVQELVTSNYFTDKIDYLLPTEMFTFAQPKPKMIYYKPTLSDMEFAIEQTEAIEYLSKFTETFQRTIVRNHLMYCPYYSLCDIDSFAVPTFYSCCTPCDCKIDSCMDNNTCCPSIIPENVFKLQNDTYQSQSESSSNLKGSNIHKTACISADMSHQTGSGFEAISNCPGDDKGHTVDMCTKAYTRESVLLDVVPVTSRTTKMVFRNKYCAKCNNVPERDMVYFDPHFSCTDQSYINNVTSTRDAISLSFSLTECDISFINNDDENILIRKCKYIIDICNVTGNWETYDPVLEMACSLYVSPMYHDGIPYKNVQCALCNGNIPRVTCDDGNSVRSFLFPFSGLLTLDSTQAIVSTEQPVVKDLQTSCNSNQMFDSLFEQCRDLVCPESSYYHDGSCIAIYSAVVANMMYVVDLRLSPITTITLEAMMAAELDLFKEIHEAFYNIHTRLETCYLEMALKTETLYTHRHSVPFEDQVLSYIDIRFKLFLSQMEGPQKPSKIIDSILAMRLNTLNIIRMHDVPLKFQIIFTQFDTTQFNLIELVHHSPQIRASLFDKNFLEKLEVLSQYSFPDADGFTKIPNIQDRFTRICMDVYKESPVIEQISCPKVSVSSDEIIWTAVPDGLLVDGLKIDRGTYYFIDEGHIMMCFEQYKRLVHHLLPPPALNMEMMISVICSSMSIISLLITIITFAIFPKLHKSLPGHNNMSLSMSLLIAQIMLLVGSLSPFDQYSTECKSIGLVIHFSWLCAIFWMNVCTYHVYKTLTRSALPNQTFEVRKCILYHFYVLVSSMIFVGVNILISKLESDGVGYGGKYCYITSQQRILITFVAPTILVVLVDLFMFLIVICRVTKSSDVRKSVKHGRNDLVIFAKLATLTGISWIFGFLYIWTNISALSYVFTVLNAGQGVFIMVSFVLNRRVMSMFKDLYRECPKKKSSKRCEDYDQPNTSSSIL